MVLGSTFSHRSNIAEVSNPCLSRSKSHSNIHLPLMHPGSPSDGARPESKDAVTKTDRSPSIPETPVSLDGSPKTLHAVHDKYRVSETQEAKPDQQPDSPDASTQAAIRQKDDSDALFEAEPYSLGCDEAYGADDGWYSVEGKVVSATFEGWIELRH